MLFARLHAPRETLNLNALVQGSPLPLAASCPRPTRPRGRWWCAEVARHDQRPRVRAGMDPSSRDTCTGATGTPRRPRCRDATRGTGCRYGLSPVGVLAGRPAGAVWGAQTETLTTSSAHTFFCLLRGQIRDASTRVLYTMRARTYLTRLVMQCSTLRPCHSGPDMLWTSPRSPVWGDR
jgi:hypothetical protein